MIAEKEMLARFVRWGEEREDVRAMVLTSTRTTPGGYVDEFSDYDIIIYTRDILPYFQSRDWLEYFGHVLVLYRDPISEEFGFKSFAYITQFEDGLKIDFTLAEAGQLPAVAADAQRNGLSPDLDLGYKVLLDKDHLSAGLPEPTHRAFIPGRPTQVEFETEVEVFFHEATYVAKHLRRDDLMPAKFNLDHMMKGENLRQMLEWHMQLTRNWSQKAGAYGKRLKRYTRPDLWAELERTYVGPGADENWDAMFATIDLFRKVALEVGQALGLAYPMEMDRRATAYLRRMWEGRKI